MRIAVVGYGLAGAARLRAYRRASGAQVVAIVEPFPAHRLRATAEHPEVDLYETLDALLAATTGTQVDVVDICTPPVTHAPLSTQALASGRHVICEKPVAVSLSEATALAARARAAGRLLYPAHNYGVSPAMRQLAEARDAGIGVPMTAIFQVERTGSGQGSHTWRPHWRRDISVSGGGVLLDHGTHCVYMALRLFGTAPSRVSCRIGWTGGAASQLDETVEAELEFPAGSCRIWLSWLGSRRRNYYSLAGPAGAVDVHDDQVVRRVGGKEERFAIPSPSNGSTHEEWLPAMFADFADSVARPERWDAVLAELVDTAAVIDMAYASARRGHRVEMPVVS